MTIKNPATFSKAESKRRFEAALRGALTTPAKPLKDIARTKKAARPKTKRGKDA